MEKTLVERSLDASIKDGAAYAVMLGLGESWVGTCALFLGAGPSLVGLLSTIPLFLGACAQMLTPLVLDRTRRRKGHILAGATVQMLSWIPMIGALYAPRPAAFGLLMGGCIAYFVSVHFTVPAWMSLMGDLVPTEIRGRYFGFRNAAALLLQLLSVGVAGVGLWVFEQGGHERLGFLVLFLGALVARGVSLYYLWRMVEPPYRQEEQDRFTLRQFLARLPESNFAKFALFVACLNASAHFVGCLFIPYWRDDLRYSYGALMAVLAAALLIQIPALVFWGRVADRYGNRRVLAATSLGIAILPAMWLLSTHLAFALFMQFWSGFWWSGFTQSASNFLLDAVSPPKRARCTAYLNLMANTGVLLGGVAGSWAIRVVPPRIGPLEFPYAFWTLLILSTVLRGSVAAIFLPLIREVREVPRVGTVEMLFHATREAAEAAVNLVTGLLQGGGERERD